MTAEIFAALIPYVISAAMSYAIAWYCWRRRTVAGAAFFAALALCRGLLTTGYIFELLSPTLGGKIFWDDLQFYPSYIGSIALLAFAVRHGDYRVWNRRVLWGGLLAVVVLFSLATITNPVYHLLRADASLVPGRPFSALTYSFTTGFLLYVAYTLILYFASLWLLILKWLRASAPFRGQLGTIIFGNAIPLAGATLTLFGVIPTFDRDTTPFWFAVSNVIVWWGLFHYRLFDLAPVARDKLIEQMGDIVIVVDADNRVVDVNPAAERVRGASAKELIGKPAAEAFPAQVDLIKRFEGMDEVDAEIMPAGLLGARTYHLTATPLMERGDKLIGRLIVAHDITQLKDTQAELNAERAKLEKEVAKRTAALTRANQKLKQEAVEREQIARDLKDRDERLSRLTDAAFEGIAISKNGVFVETNQQMADMLGMMQEELVGKKIIDFVAPESREDVERRIRLNNEETAYDHIAMRQDGTKFPVEVRVRTLRVKGRKLRMTAVRDMSVQRRAEQSVRVSEERFRLILENMPILLDAFDENNNIIVWNKACEESTGYSASEIIGNQRAMEILYPDPAYRARVMEASLDPNNQESTFELIAKDGEPRMIMWFDVFRSLQIPGWASWGLGLDVTERHRAEHAERQQRSLAEALADTAKALSSNLELDDVLDRVLANVGKAVEHDSADVMLIEGSHARVVRSRGYGEEVKPENTVLDFENFPLLARLVESDQPLVIPDTHKDPLWVTVPESAWIRSLLAAPVRAQGKMIGVINLLRRTPLSYTEEDSRRLLAFADQAAIAIHNAQLYRTEREQRELAEALSDSTAAVSSTLSQEEVLNSILDNLDRVLPHDAANVMLVDGDVARIVGKRGYERWPLDEPIEQMRFPILKRANLQKMRKTLRPVVVPDTYADPQWYRTPGFELVQSYAGAPIRVGGKVIGFLNLSSEAPNFFDDSVIERLKAFADQAAIAMHNAQLYRTERENRELAEALRDTTAALSSKLSQDEVLNSILDNLERVLPHDAANVMLVEGDVARIIGKQGYERSGMDDEMGRMRFMIREYPPLQQMLTTLRPVVITDTGQDPNWDRTRGAHWVYSYAGAPIRVGDEVIGFLNVDSAKPGFFDESTAERLTAFAGQAAIALHNAQLYETERRERILAQMFQQLAERVQGATSPSSILKIVLQALANLLPYRSAMIGLLEEAGIRVEAEERHDHDPSILGKLYAFKDNPRLLQILSQGQPALFREEDLPTEWSSLPGVDSRSAIWVAMPLTTWDVTTGLLCLTLSDSAAHTEDVIAAVATFSQRARLALENSRLLLELLQSKGDLREAQSYLVRSAELAIAGEIATGVAHQISNPLTSVMAHAHLLLQKLPPDNPLYEYGKAIKEATDRAATVVQRMLDFARAREMEMQPVDVNASLNTAASLVEPQITASARLVLDLDPGLPPIIGSREHLEDVWINLLINARDALQQQPDGVISLTSTLDRTDGKTVVIQFKDNGPGIPLDAQGRIFSSFFTTKEEGVGLGLAICYDIITQHHGTIHVESREGRGANFIVRLPGGPPSIGES